MSCWYKMVAVCGDKLSLALKQAKRNLLIDDE